MSKIFLTGATGFVGRTILKMAQKQGHQVICAVRKPTRPNEVFFDLTDD
ncbi:NAD-dependent epimerase/dehydratase family protein, partial [Photobacterium damselae subsp. damselae]|nr:NAD-dependent epimerase/dehydratase family protein [Photobacterium damselae subsp. damselae]